MTSASLVSGALRALTALAAEQSGGSEAGLAQGKNAEFETMPFGPLEISFDAHVLRPRSWTLAQSEWAAELSDGTAMLELGSGAGQIGLAAASLSGNPVVQVDVSAAACRWATHNAAANGLAHEVTQRCGTADEVLGVTERFAVVIADPPYVPSAEVYRFPEDPLSAIDGGLDGLECVRSFVAAVEPHLAPEGSLVIQVWGMSQVEGLARWLVDPDTPALAVTEVRAYGDDRALARLIGTHGEHATNLLTG